jgi:hypothetical protein
MIAHKGKRGALVFMQVKTDALLARRGMFASIRHVSARLRTTLHARRARAHVSMKNRWAKVTCLRSAELLHVL